MLCEPHRVVTRLSWDFYIHVYLVVCRVYIGNSSGEHVIPFTIALSKVIAHLGTSGFEVKEESLTLTEARTRKFSAKLLVDWLLGSHIHFVTTHPCQGWHTTATNVEEVYDEFSRLKYHPGFPMGVQLQCPIFTQDKWNYLQHIPSKMKSCKISIAEANEEFDAVKRQVQR